MELTEEIKKEIDNMEYAQLLSKWRHSPIGDPMFQGDSGDYFAKVMREKKDSLTHENQVAISKSVGW